MPFDGYQTSRRQDWTTPLRFYRELDAEFHFTLDAAASDENAKCAHYFTAQTDGLKQSWEGHTVWCNPPYNEVGKWAEKAAAEAERGVTSILLTFARTDTRWFHDHVLGKAEIRFVKGRIHFGGGGTAPCPSLVLVYSPQRKG